MPVEIKELCIKAVVGATGNEPANKLGAEELAKLKKEITRDVTEKVLETLRQKTER